MAIAKDMAIESKSPQPPQPQQTLQAFVRRKLLEHLAANWEPQCRLPPISDIAGHYKVSVGTVQQAISGLVSEGILVARRRVGTTLAPDCSQATLRRQIARDDHAESPAEAVNAIEGKRVQINRPGDDRMHVEISESCARVLLQRGAEVELSRHAKLYEVDRSEFLWADAVVLVQPPKRLADFWHPRQAVLMMGTAACTIDRAGRYDQVNLDDEQGSFLAGRKMREAGCRRVAFLGVMRDKYKPSSDYDTTSHRRLCGFERGWGEPIDVQNCIFARSYETIHGRVTVKQYLDMADRPEGIFAATDDLAIGFILEAQRLGLKPGCDYQIVGFDHQQMAEELPGGPLTTVEVPRQEMGHRGAELLVQRFANLDAPVQCVHLGCRWFEGATLPKVVG